MGRVTLKKLFEIVAELVTGDQVTGGVKFVVE